MSRWLARALFVAVLISTVLVSRAEAQDRVPLGEFETEVGAECTVTTANNQSVWPGNVLVLTSGESTIETSGVEEEPGLQFEVEIVSDGLVSAFVVVAPGNQTSLEITMVCQPIISTTSTTERVVTTPTTTPTVPTTPPPPDPCPPGGLACTGNQDMGLLVGAAAILIGSGAILAFRRS